MTFFSQNCSFCEKMCLPQVSSLLDRKKRSVDNSASAESTLELELQHAKSRDRCYDSLNIFAKKLAFKLCKNLIITLNLRKTLNYLPKIVENYDHNNDPRHSSINICNYTYIENN
jgi:ERCC4-related helicase